MDYIKLSFNLPLSEEKKDMLTHALGEIGFESFDESELTYNAYVPKPDYNATQISEVCDEHGLHMPWVEEIPAQNWNATWESNYQPIEIKNALRIRAPFHATNTSFKHEIVISPKMSFGTGHHDTTRLMAEQMELTDFKDKTVLDMGCGTGILAIYAEKLGAAKIIAIDIEDFAYENTIENCLLNACSHIFVEKGSVEKIPPWNFHVILANINKNILLGQVEHYAQHLQNRGSLFLSGFFDSDCDSLIAQCNTVGMEFVSKTTANNWACLHFIKKIEG